MVVLAVKEAVTREGDLPRPLYALSGARLMKHAVVTGGTASKSTDKVFQYDETARAWSEIGRMKKARHFHAVVELSLLCSVDCKVEDWSSWSDCSATCGGGTKTRGRGVVQDAENGGAVCPALEEEEPCNIDQCPVDCGVEDWSTWSDCSATCGGGTKTRGRGVVQEAENGGAVCPALEDEKSCNTDQCPVDCEVEDWSSWSDCSATCGGGNKTRGRGVVQEAENGGAVCPALEEKEPCNTDQCKDARIYWSLVAIPILFFLIGVFILCWKQSRCYPGSYSDCKPLPKSEIIQTTSEFQAKEQEA